MEFYGFVIVALSLWFFWKMEKEKPPAGPDSKYLIDDPLLPFVDLSPWGFEERDGMVGFFGETLYDFPAEFTIGGFELRHKNSGKAGGESFFRIYGWTVRNLDPNHPYEQYYDDPLLHDARGRAHVLVR